MTASGWRLRGLLGATALLVIGAIGGVVIDRTLVRHGGGWGAEEMHADREHNSLLMTLRHELDLDDAQLEAIRAIVDRHQARVDLAWESIRPVMTTAVDSVEHEMETVLRPDQIQRFRDWFQRHRAESEGRH